MAALNFWLIVKMPDETETPETEEELRAVSLPPIYRPLI
jgi:hypothetical protein